MEQPSQTPQWRLLNRTDQMAYHPNRGTYQETVVSFVLADGTHASVAIPTAQLTPEAVQQAVQAYADQHEAMMAQQGPLVPTPPQRHVPRP